MRAPALVGGAIYIVASYALCWRISSQLSVRCPLFLCLVYNPFIMDYMVAARGYGLALGFLIAAVWAISDSRFATASICAGLSFCANFSFAYIAAAVMLIFTVWATGQTKNWRTLSPCLIPGGVTAFVICGSTVWTWPKGQLYYGAPHLTQMWQSIVSASFDELNPFIVNPLLAASLEGLGAVLPYFVAAVLIWQTLRILRTGQPLGLILARAMGIALLLHWLAFRLVGIPLPMARTAIFFVPLAFLLIGIGAALPSGSRFGAWPCLMSIAALIMCAAYFIGCLRLTYFKEWKFDAEVKDVFGVLQSVHRRYGIREFGTDWRYSSTLNFYREYFHDLEIGPFGWTDPPVPDKPAYVLYYPLAEGFIEKQNLHVIYRGKLSDVVVAVRQAELPSTTNQPDEDGEPFCPTPVSNTPTKLGSDQRW